MLTLSEKTINEAVGDYLINVLDIPQLWGRQQSLKQKDEQRRRLHDKLVKLLNIDDRDIIGKCADKAYFTYIKFKELSKAKNAFCHEFNKLTGQNVMTPEQEKKLDEQYKFLSGEKSVRETIGKNLTNCCETERKRYYTDIAAKYREMFSKKTPEELLALLEKVPDTYTSLYQKMLDRSHAWSVWFDQMNYDYGNRFCTAYYDMVWYFNLGGFIHDYSRRMALVKDGIKRMRLITHWDEHQDILEWAVKTLAIFHTWFAGAEEYVNTPYEKIMEIYLSFKDNGDKGKD